MCFIKKDEFKQIHRDNLLSLHRQDYARSFIEEVKGDNYNTGLECKNGCEIRFNDEELLCPDCTNTTHEFIEKLLNDKKDYEKTINILKEFIFTDKNERELLLNVDEMKSRFEKKSKEDQEMVNSILNDTWFEDDKEWLHDNDLETSFDNL